MRNLQRYEQINVQSIHVGNEGKQLDVVDKGCVVIFPTIGAYVHEIRLLRDKNVQIVDTTCPWVSKVCTIYWRQKETRSQGERNALMSMNMKSSLIPRLA